MKRIVGALFLPIWSVAPASATSITWSSATLSDDNGGAFLTGASATAIGKVWTLTLPNYSISGNFGLPPDEVDLGVSATAVGGVITGVTYRYAGLFAGVGSASFVQSANAASATGAFAAPNWVGFLPLAPVSVVNLLTVLNLDGGDFVDSAAVTSVQFELSITDVPEPSTIVLVAVGAATLMRRRIRCSGSR